MDHHVSGGVRRVDEMGRVIIPADLRRACGIDIGDYVDFQLSGDSLVLSRHTDRCTFCGGSRDVTVFRDKPVCGDCVAELRTRV